MKCWRKACNFGKNSSSLMPPRKAKMPLKLTIEISLNLQSVRFPADENLEQHGSVRNLTITRRLLTSIATEAELLRRFKERVFVKIKIVINSTQECAALRWPCHRNSECRLARSA